MHRSLYASLCFLLFVSNPAAADIQKTKALVEARIAEQPDLADSFDWLKESYRLGVQGYAGVAFVRSGEEILARYVDDGVITAYEFDLAQKQAAEVSYDDSIRSLLNRLTRGSADEIVLPFSLRRAAAQQSGRIKSERLAKILGMDLDGNWEISRSEIDAQALSDRGLKPDSVTPYDLDGDGIITIPEITASIDADPDIGNPKEAARLRAMTLVDLDRDDLVERGEVRDFLEYLETAVVEGRPGPSEEAMTRAVADGWAKRGPWRDRQTPTEGPECGPVAPKDDQDFVIVSTFAGTAATNLALDGPARQTTVATVQIEPGDKKMFLLLASMDSVVWNLTGDVDRIDHLVVQRAGVDGADNAGVVGIDAGKVAFVPFNACIKPITEIREDPLAASVIGPWVAWNRTPSMVVANYNMRTSFVPSGAVKTERSYPTSSFDLIVRDALFEKLGDSYVKVDLDGTTVLALGQYWQSSTGAKDGIYFFEPGEVTVSGPEEFYPVLPGTAGLVQLIKEGTLKVLQSNMGGKHLLLTKAIPNLPSELDFWDNTRIDLAPGIPRPVGEARGLKIYSIDEGKCLTDVSCD